MDFKSLHCFAELVRLQSFSAAASALNLTQPTISKTIQALEEELGVPLLVKENGRKKRQVATTPIGEEVYRHALNLLHERDLLLARIDGATATSKAVRCGWVWHCSAAMLSNALFRFHRQWPGIDLTFLEQGSLAIEQSLRNNELDAGQLLAPVHEDFDSITLCDYQLVVLMPRTQARHAALSLKSLQHEPFILFGSGFSLNETIQTACRSQGFTPNVVCRTGQWNLLADMVAHHMGIALLPEYYARKINPDIFAVVPLTEPEIRWQLTMAWKKHQRPPRAQGLARHHQGRVQEIEKGRLKTFQTTSSGKSTEQKDKANHFDKHNKEIVTD